MRFFFCLAVTPSPSAAARTRSHAEELQLDGNATVLQRPPLRQGLFVSPVQFARRKYQTFA